MNEERESKTQGVLVETLENIKKANSVRLNTFITFFLLCLFINLTKIYYIKLEIVIILGSLVVNAAFSNILFAKTKLRGTVTAANITYLIVMILEAVAILWIVHFDGSIPFVGMLAIATYSLVTYFIFNEKKYRQAFFVIVVINYIALITLECFGILDAPGAARFKIDLYKNYNLLFMGIVFETVLMISIVSIVNFFWGKSQSSLKVLIKKEEELKEAKQVLEIRVKSRTQELEEEKNSLEKKVQERTKELQNKINELEKFQKITIGRELKMIELKKEIDKFNRKTENS